MRKESKEGLLASETSTFGKQLKNELMKCWRLVRGSDSDGGAQRAHSAAEKVLLFITELFILTLNFLREPWTFPLILLSCSLLWILSLSSRWEVLLKVPPYLCSLSCAALSRPNTSTWAEVPFCVFCGTFEPLISLFLSFSTLPLSLQCQPLLFLPESLQRLTASPLRRNTTPVLKWFVNTRWRFFFVAIFTTPISIFRDEVSLAFISKYTTPIPFFKRQQTIDFKRNVSFKLFQEAYECLYLHNCKYKIEKHLHQGPIVLSNE